MKLGSAFKQSILAAAASGFALSAQADVTVTVAGSGGTLAEIINEIFEVPFTAETGIRIESIPATNRSAAIEAQLLAGRPEWDITELSGFDYIYGHRRGWFMEIDWATLDPENRIPEEVRFPDAVPYTAFAHVLGYRTDKSPPGLEMTGWSDFWDLERFPGPRGMQDTPNYNLEFALLADGVPKDQLYEVLATPEGLDRAFAKLDEIKPAVAVWWTSNGQSQQALTDGEVYYTTNANGRFKSVANEGVPVRIVWDGGASLLGYWAILNGTDAPEEARKYLSFVISSPERAAEFATRIPYPLYTRGALDLMSPEDQAWLPTREENMAGRFTYDDAFWADNIDRIRERWLEWKLQ